MAVIDNNRKVLEGKLKASDPKKQSREENFNHVGVKKQTDNTVKQVEKQPEKQQKVKSASVEKLIRQDSKIRNEKKKQNKNEDNSKEKVLESEKQNKEIREKERKVSKATNVSKEENRTNEGLEAGNDGENKIQMKGSSTVSKEKKDLLGGKGEGSRQQAKKSEKDNKQRECVQDIAKNENESKKVENHEKTEVKDKEDKNKKREKIERKSDKEKVKVEENKRKISKAKENNGEAISNVTETERNVDDREREKKKSDPKRKKQNESENKTNEVLEEEKKATAVAAEPKEKDRRQSKGREEKTLRDKSKEGKGNEQKALSKKGDNDKVDTLESESKPEKAPQKSKWKRNTVVKVGAWVKLDSQGEEKNNKHMREEEKLEEEKENAEIEKIGVKSTGSSPRKVEKQCKDAQNLKICDMEDNSSVESRKNENNDTLEADRKKVLILPVSIICTKFIDIYIRHGRLSSVQLFTLLNSSMKGL